MLRIKEQAALDSQISATTEKRRGSCQCCHLAVFPKLWARDVGLLVFLGSSYVSSNETSLLYSRHHMFY